MQTVGVKALKNKVCEYLRLAAKSETVLVTDRGRAVAEIIAPRVPTEATTAEAKVGEMVRLHARGSGPDAVAAARELLGGVEITRG